MNSEYSILKSGTTDIHLLKFEPFDTRNELDKLTSDEIKRLSSFSSASRRMEFIATRILRHKLFGVEHIHYDAHGAPYILNEGYISVSHTHNYVGIAINKEYRVGLDLETHRQKILPLLDKFLNESEKKIFDTTSYIEMTKVWSAKEALYKLAGRKKIIFKSDLLLNNEDGQWKGQIINPNERIFLDLDIFDSDNTIVSINNGPIRIEKYTI
ncbi:MAG: 4'-phosphopantetheinyl transferase family protein [Crocinitomicaceae bacterium]